MNDTEEVLLLADEKAGQELASRLEGASLVHRSDPYDALAEMSRRRYGAVVLSADDPEFEGLCRASRRLQKDGGLFAVCSPAGEPAVRPLVGQVIDDYFIWPLGRSDLARIRRAASAAPSPETPAGLTPRQFSKLVEATRSAASLETAVAEIVAQAMDSPVAWSDGESLPDQVRPLLLSIGDSPRVLVPGRPLPRLEPLAERLLQALRECLPALTAAARRTESLHKLAITDHLTGAYNRRFFYHQTDRVLLRARQRGLRATVLLWDIDDFKRYNEAYGYAAGDEILRDTVALMRRISRSQDLVARIGGDEFAVLFWDPEGPRSPSSRPLESAFTLADRFRKAVARHDFASLGPDAVGTLTISGGLATFPADGSNCRELLRAADRAIRAAKQSGKNAIRLVGKE